MSEKGNRMDGSEAAASARKDAWAWHPPLPLQGIPVFVWPPRPLAALKFFASVAFLGSVMIPFGALAIVTWTYLQPALERCAQLQADWILQIYARNLALMVIVAGGLHLYFYAFKRQGSERKFDLRDLVKAHRRFFTGNQVRDNMLWSLASGVTVWTAYEAFFMWAYANDLLPYYLDWTAHPVLFVLMLLAIPFWASLHFYFIHRLLHWPPLYRIAHAVHHRNDNTGPWSGLSMHPIEHIIYLSSVLIHVVLASHPIHILFHNQWNTLGAATTHTGFECITFKGIPILNLGSFHHQLHHRYYHCNYGNEYMPWDRWFGSDNDGTPDAVAKMRERRRAVPRPATT
jgi:sterol desaturase/sphingolipid hydroxylase (fatty acid hydroxylase superfamily)